jgi:flagellin
VTALGIRGLTVTGASNTNAEDAITSLDAALSIKLTSEAHIGAYEQLFTRAIETAQIQRESEAQAVSKIRDLDFAEEVMNLTRNQILVQVGLAMLAQANQLPQAILGLI